MQMGDLALRLAVLKVLADRVKTGERVVRADVADQWVPGTRIPAVLPGNRTVGTVTLTEGREQAKVTDPAAFLEWVRANHPDEIVESVRSSFEKQLLERVRKDGELVPGVSVVYGEPYPTVRLNGYAQQAITEAWQSGELDWSIVPEIEAP